MFDRYSRRLALWALCSMIPAAAAGATVSGYAPAPLVSAAPLLSATALLVAGLGWRRLHRELERQRAAESGIRESARRLHEAMHASADGLLLLRAVRHDDGALEDFAIADANGTAAALLYRSRNAVVGQRLRGDLGDLGRRLFDQYAAALATGSPIVEELRVDRRQFAAGWLLHQAMPTSDGLAVTVRDISARKREERRLRRASLTDDLTGLANRRGFMALADQQLRNARRHGHDAVVLYADMDGFKQLNDQFGHAIGDRALMLVGRVLRETVRDCDVVARLGGDEFTILACEADGNGARAIQRRIEERLAVVNASGQLPAPLALTIGFTRVRPSDQAGIAELLARADQLLYSRKRRRALARSVGREGATTVSTRAPEGAALAASARATGPTPARTGREARRTPRVPTVAVPPAVAAVADAAVRNLPRVATGETRPPLPPLPLSRPA